LRIAASHRDNALQHGIRTLSACARYPGKESAKESAMPNQREIDRKNDAKFLTPLLLLGLILVGGILIYLMLGPPPVS
jgi:hypothetical protein